MLKRGRTVALITMVLCLSPAACWGPVARSSPAAPSPAVVSSPARPESASTLVITPFRDQSPTSTASLAPGGAADSLRMQTPAALAARASELVPVRPGEFVKRQGSMLTLEGQEFRFNGNNAYFMQPEIAYGNLAGVEETLDDMAALGMAVVRTIGFNDSDPTQDPAAIQTSPGVYQEKNLVSLDRAIAAAKSRDIRLILYLTNNWEAYGGVDRYVQWYEAVCGCDARHSDFYTNKTIRGWFKDYVRMLLDRANTLTGIRYKDEPAILAWELGNELRNEGGSPEALLDWVAEMSAFIKSLDPNHLVADGGEGFDDDSSLYPGLSNDYAVRGDTGDSYHRLVDLPQLDLVSYHLYPSKWGLDGSGDVEIWVRAHEQLARAAGKVAYLGEYGAAEPDARRAEVFERWLNLSVNAERSAGSLLWELAYDARPDNDGFTVYYPGDVQTGAVLQKYAARSVSASQAYTYLYEVMDAYETGGTPRLLESYLDTASSKDGDIAWLYDQALVILALLARGTQADLDRAGILASSLVYAQNNDPDFSDGRLRDAYRAAAFKSLDGKAAVASPGSAAGNMAWAAVALLRSYEVLGGQDYLQAAQRLGQWIYDHTYDTRGMGGYNGGLSGPPPAQNQMQWKATEHNVDIYVAFLKLHAATGEAQWLDRAKHAGSFVRAMWNPDEGYYWTGTLEDGATLNPRPVPADAQSWTMLAFGQASGMGNGLPWAERDLKLASCPGCEDCQGFRFSSTGSGCWWEGTAHMVLAYQVAGEPDRAGGLLDELMEIQSTAVNGNGRGLVSACPGGADTGYGWAYPNALHIGATAWYIFAARGHNPFWGISTDEAIPGAGSNNAFLELAAREAWRYLHSDWATDNHLPWSWRSSQLEGGDYANPAEIGFYLLSYIGAYELQRDWSPAWDSVEAELGAALDQLEAWQSGTQNYQPNGANAYRNSVFYQAYWINEDPPVVGASGYDHQVPSVDNAWLAACLITLREYTQAEGRAALVRKADHLLKDMDFRLWWKPDQQMFTWGAPEDPQGGALADTYSNENRIINFVARALGQLSQAEFLASLDALQQPSGTYDRNTPDPRDDITVGKVNWDGSYFTYTTPALFIREMELPYGQETIDRATEAQIAYAEDRGYPAWGISDAFDAGAGGFVERGTPPRGSGNALDDPDDGLVAPHVSALALMTGYGQEAVLNLQALHDLYPGLYDLDYGFKDSVNVNSGQSSDRFSALAKEWEFLSLVNTLGNGVIWRYFYLDAGVQRAHAELRDRSFTLYLPAILWHREF